MSQATGPTASLGVAILGCAHRPHAWSYARALTSSGSARLSAVIDPDLALAHSVADDFGARCHADLDGVHDGDVDAVVVCSPTAQHRLDVERAASRRLHVLCEKPLATDRDDALAMIAACTSAGVVLQTAFVSRFLPHVRRIKQAMDAQALGDLVGVRAGNRGVPPLPPAYPSWITDPAQAGGGALIDHSVHLVDVLRHLSGLEVVRVAAETAGLLWSAGVEDCALLSLVFDNAAVASIDPSWSVPKHNPWDYDFFVRLVGSRGSVDVDDVSESVQAVGPSLGDGMRLVGFGEDADAAMLEAFVSSIRQGRSVAPCASGEDGLRALEVALAGYASAAEGARFVDL